MSYIHDDLCDECGEYVEDCKCDDGIDNGL